MSESVGIIGLGHMGKAVARRLHAAGHKVLVYNRTKSKADSLLQIGAALAGSPLEVAQHVGYVFTLVADDAAMEAVAFGDGGFAQAITVGKLHIDMSTLTEGMVERVSQAVRTSGGYMVHAPILGGPLDVFTGNATICVGGAKSKFQAALPLLEDISRPVHHVGDVTHGTRMKMALNIMLTHFLTGMSSSLAFARKGDLPVELVHEILCRVSGGVVEKLGDKMLSGEKGVTFSVRNLEKDQGYFLNSAEAMGLDLPTIKAARELFRQAVADGLGNADFTAVFRYLLKKADQKEDGQPG